MWMLDADAANTSGHRHLLGSLNGVLCDMRVGIKCGFKSTQESAYSCVDLGSQHNHPNDGSGEGNR